jgi:Xaa-Pro aminopeptidase
VTDPARLRADRLARLRSAMAQAGDDALVLTAAAAVRYATGAAPPHGDSSLEAARPFAAVVTARTLHVLGIEPECTPPGVDARALSRAPVRAAAALAELLGDARRIGVDRLPLAVAEALARALPRATFGAADRAVLAARAVKTADEIALLREAQRLNEEAIAEVLPAIVPGVREVELTGRFLAAMALRGVTACHVEPIWCVVPRRAAEAPWTFPGGLPYRELTSGRVLAGGDQVMIDTGMLHAGYMSDFGCTWTCGGTRPRDRGLRARWEEIVAAVLAECRPGATAAALHRAARAANGQGRPAPWPVPLYLAHGIGIGGVEPPFVGTDLGIDAEETMTLAPGMVLVLEPYVWEDGAGGYRAEQTIAITASGHERLSAPPP